MSHHRRQFLATAGVTAALATLGGLAPAQDPAAKVKPADVTAGSDAKADGQGETVAGVVYKIETAEGKAGGGPARRLRINSSIPWADFVRDQARPAAGAEKAGAAKADGKDSVATLGHPRDQDVVVLVDLNDETKVATRFRSATDDATQGAKTPAGALKAEEKAVDQGATAKADGPDAAKKADATTVKEGQFVEVTFRHRDARNLASRVTIFAPVDRAATPATDGNTRAPEATPKKP